MTSYINAINEAIVEEVADLPNAVLYGENINNGSFMSGLTRNLQLKSGNGSRIINVGNCENTHCGVGFGIMLSGTTAVLFAKQLDFMLLGLDQFVNTYNFVRSRPELEPKGSFTIISIVCDQGLQGPQSSFNGLGDICSLARIPGYTLTNNQDTPRILRSQLRTPGFGFICLSQRLYPTEFPDLPLVYAATDNSYFQYYDGNDVTIVCFNFSLPQGRTLHQGLLNRGASAALFSANYVFPQDWQRIKESVARTGKLVVIDDSKSVSLYAHAMLHVLSEESPPFQRILISREADIDFGVCPDDLRIDYDSILAQLGV
jgi:pyruvate dehydrogenase E1 component beta subunit